MKKMFVKSSTNRIRRGHILTNRKIIRYIGDKYSDIKKMADENDEILLDIGLGYYKRLPVKLYIELNKIESIKLPVELLVWSYMSDECGDWEVFHRSSYESLTPIEFIKIVKKLEDMQVALNELSAMSMVEGASVNTKKLKITYKDGKVKKVRLSKFLEIYFPNIPF